MAASIPTFDPLLEALGQKPLTAVVLDAGMSVDCWNPGIGAPITLMSCMACSAAAAAGVTRPAAKPIPSVAAQAAAAIMMRMDVIL